MSAFTTPSKDVTSELLALERRRCDAICANDLGIIEPLMSDTLTYVHKSGEVENKRTYLEGLTGLREFRSVEREALEIRMSGEVAIMTGIQRVLVRRRGDVGDFREISVFATQVWVRGADGWQMDVYHSTGI